MVHNWTMMSQLDNDEGRGKAELNILAKAPSIRGKVDRPLMNADWPAEPLLTVACSITGQSTTLAQFSLNPISSLSLV